MNPNRKIIFFQGKPPMYILPLVLILALVVFAILAVFGFFLGIAIGVAVIVFGILRLMSSFNKKKARQTIEENGRTTVILDQDDFEVIEKGKNT